MMGKRQSNPSLRPRIPAAGFTLTELLIGVAMVGILTAIGLPWLTQLTADSAVSTRASVLHAGLAATRSEAVKRNTRVTMCPSTNQRACAGGIAPSWSGGWIIFADAGTVASVDGDDAIIQVQNGFPGGVALVASGDVGSYVSYLGDGQSRTGDGAALDGSFTLCADRDGVRRRRLTISPGTGYVAIDVLSGASTCAS